MPLLTPTAPSTNAVSSSGRGQRAKKPIAVGGATFALVLLTALVCPEPVVGGLLALLVVAAPTARRFSRRLLQNLTLASVGLVTLGWAPSPGARIPVALALAWGLLAGSCADRGWRWVLPSTGAVDALIPLAGGIGVLVARPLLGASPTSAMALLMGGWDHAGHFSMYLAQREGPAQAVPMGQTWYYVNYPQLFHAFMARLGELVWGAPGYATTEVVRYAAIQGIVFVATVVVAVAAAIDASCTHGRRAAVGAGLLAISLFAGFPGASLLAQGHLSATWSALAALMVIQIARRRRPLGTLDMVCAASCVVAVAAWPLIIPIVAPPALGILVQGWDTTKRRRWMLSLLAGCTLMAGGYLVWVSCRADPAGHIVTAGGIVHTGVMASFLVPVLSWSAAFIKVRKHVGVPDWRPVLWASAAGIAMLGAIALFQLASTGSLSYYFWKTALIQQLVVTAVVVPDLAVAIDQMIRRVFATPATRRFLQGLTSVGIAMVGLGGMAGQPSAVAALAYPFAMTSWATQQDLAAEVIAASKTHTPLATSIWVRESDAYSPALADQWLHSITRTHTTPVGGYELLLNGARYGGRKALAEVGEEILRNSDFSVLVSDPVLVDKLSGSIPPASGHRVVYVPAAASPRGPTSTL